MLQKGLDGRQTGRSRSDCRENKLEKTKGEGWGGTQLGSACLDRVRLCILAPGCISHPWPHSEFQTLSQKRKETISVKMCGLLKIKMNTGNQKKYSSSLMRRSMGLGKGGTLNKHMQSPGFES